MGGPMTPRTLLCSSQVVQFGLVAIKSSALIPK